MKRFLVIPLMLLYLLAASGLRISLHYCGGHVSSWHLVALADDCSCGGRKKVKKSKCCSDKVVLAKMEQDHQGVTAFLFDHHPAEALLPLPVLSVAAADCIGSGRVVPVHLANAPPGLWQDIPLYKLHQRFTYYG